MATARTRRKAKLGQYMQELRLRQVPAMIPERAAELALCRRETVTRLENGTMLPSPVLLGSLLGVYQATADERAEALRLRKYAAQEPTAVEHAADLPAKYLAFRMDESDAVTERTIDHVTIPGLLQTAGYAGALAEAGRKLNPSVGWEQRAAAERQSRQKLLSNTRPLRLHSLIGESVVLNQVGGAEVMAEQLRHLLAVGAQGNVTVQVVPLSAGAWGTMTGSAIILGFDGSADHGYVYLDYAAGGESVENEDDVVAFVDLFEHAATELALTPAQSAKLIKAALKKLEGR
jgi:hypothetical protein